MKKTEVLLQVDTVLIRRRLLTFWVNLIHHFRCKRFPQIIGYRLTKLHGTITHKTTRHHNPHKTKIYILNWYLAFATPKNCINSVRCNWDMYFVTREFSEHKICFRSIIDKTHLTFTKYRLFCFQLLYAALLFSRPFLRSICIIQQQTGSIAR